MFTSIHTRCFYYHVCRISRISAISTELWRYINLSIIIINMARPSVKYLGVGGVISV